MHLSSIRKFKIQKNIRLSIHLLPYCFMMIGKKKQLKSTVRRSRPTEIPLYFPNPRKMLLYGSPVHLAAGEYGGHDEAAQEICGHDSQGMPHLAELQRHPEFQLLVQDVDRMVVVQLQQALQDAPSHILVIFFLGLLHNLVEGFNFFLRAQNPGENGVALGLGSQVGKTLINNIRLHVLFGILETRYRLSSALARLTRTHLLLLHRALLRRANRPLDFLIIFQ